MNDLHDSTRRVRLYAVNRWRESGMVRWPLVREAARSLKMTNDEVAAVAGKHPSMQVNYDVGTRTRLGDRTVVVQDEETEKMMSQALELPAANSAAHILR